MPRTADNEQSAQDTRFKTLNRKLTRDPNLHEEYPKKVTVVLPSYEFLPLHYQHRFLLSLGISLENIRLDQFIRPVKTSGDNYNNNEARNFKCIFEQSTLDAYQFDFIFVIFETHLNLLSRY